MPVLLSDILTGEQRDSGTINSIPSGRFSLVSEGDLGIHGKWPSGTILFDDGRGYLDVEGHRIQLVPVQQDGKSEGRLDVALQALEKIRLLAELESPEDLPSPVIPPEISQSFEQTQLQADLIDVLQLGHLHQIAKSPRISMRYDEELLPVSRVKRTANNYQRHLAAHSECWQQRTFTGIIPNRMRAKISEDELHIYENRVYARLLDHLERYVRMTLIRLRELHDVLNEGESLDATEHMHRCLRTALCAIWGEAFTDGQAEDLRMLSEQQINEWEQRLRTIQQFMLSPTYKAVPSDASVPLALTNTNILINDPHYRRVRGLWAAWIKEVAVVSKDYRETFRKSQEHYGNYRHYVGLLLIRAHRALGWAVLFEGAGSWKLQHPSGIEGVLRTTTTEWVLECRTTGFDKCIKFITVVDGSDTGSTNKANRISRVMCSLADESSDNGSIWCSPLNFYSEESVIQLIQKWWLSMVAGSYGEQITKLPNVTLNNWPAGHPNGTFFSGKADVQFDAWLQQQALSPSSEREIIRRYHAASFMNYCPCCGERAVQIQSLDGRAFTAECNKCSADWRVRSTGEDWVFEVGAIDSGANTQSKESGRWSSGVLLSEPHREALPVRV
ncbi:MAG: hypothetical protein C9355_00830 [Thalassolituus maritimus]|nr:MAG: hypothetical protein C9355_00830 [Thalassolituus maritimus]